MSNVEGALDDYQRELDGVRVRNGLTSPGAALVRDLPEEDWIVWDSCQARIDATVETCRNLGYEVARLADGSWRLVFGFPGTQAAGR